MVFIALFGVTSVAQGFRDIYVGGWSCYYGYPPHRELCNLPIVPLAESCGDPYWVGDVEGGPYFQDCTLSGDGVTHPAFVAIYGMSELSADRDIFWNDKNIFGQSVGSNIPTGILRLKAGRNIYLTFHPSANPELPTRGIIGMEAGNFIRGEIGSSPYSASKWKICAKAPDVQVNSIPKLEIVEDLKKCMDSHTVIPLGLEANNTLAGLPTMVRAYITKENGDTELVTTAGILYGTREGEPLGTIGSLNSIPVPNFGTPLDELKKSQAKSLNFQLPSSWIDGTVDLRFLPAGNVELPKDEKLERTFSFLSPVYPIAMEVNQSIQSLENAVSLISYKPTTVRVFIEKAPEVTKGLRLKAGGVLYGYRDGALLPGSPLKPTNSMIGLSDYGWIPSGDNRFLLGTSLNFALPESWLSGQIELAFYPLVDGLNLPKRALIRKDFTFSDIPALKMVFLKVPYMQGGIRVEPSNEEIIEQMLRIESMLPIHDIVYRIETMNAYPNNPNLDHVLTDIIKKKSIDSYSCLWCSIAGPSTIYYGVLDGFPIDNRGGLAQRGDGMGGNGVAAGYIGDAPNAKDVSQYRHIASHEIGHALNRYHAVDDNLPRDLKSRKTGHCGEVDSPSAPAHVPFERPVPEGEVRPLLGTLMWGYSTEIWGLDNRFSHDLGSFIAVIDPRDNYEIMSDCRGKASLRGGQGQWISRYTYEDLIDPLEPFNLLSQSEPQTLLGNQSLLLITGEIDSDLNSATIMPIVELVGDVMPVSTGTYRVQVLDANGSEIVGQDFEPMTRSQESSDGPDLGSFAVALPVPASPVGAIVILHNGVPIGTLAASPTPPEVTILTPTGGEYLGYEESLLIEWAGSDDDGDELFYTVLYSPDDGGTWKTLAVEALIITPPTPVTPPPAPAPVV